MTIRLLPPQVADAIAAGEVVERPAAVVKELCENSLDAGARRIDVQVDGGGLTRIRVTDDGAGMAADELPLAVARHATSKIETADDLERVATLGFRGEALASIAAVADVRITSRRRDDASATALHVRAAEVLGQGPDAAAPGTTVEVCDLFVATPARLRFLRNPRTEAAAAQRVMADLALARPDVAVTCRLDDRLVLRSPGGTLRDALRAVFGVAAAAELVDISGSGEIGVAGAISQPRAHRGTRAGMVVVVNRRRVHNRALVAAVEEAYRGLLPGGRYPYGVVLLDVDPVEVDVNVHPTKREVRFRSERAVFAAVQRACWAATREAGPYGVAVEWGSGGGAVLHDAVPAPDGVVPLPAQGTLLHTGAAGGAVSGTAWPAAWGDAALQRVTPQPEAGAAAGGTLPPADGEAGTARDGLRWLAPLQAVGQVGGSWLVAGSPVGAVLVDPHAAHEKVLYRELLDRWQTPAGDGGAQLLLIPEVVECDALRTAALEAAGPMVARLGFILEPFGPEAVRCSAVPAAAVNADAGRLVRELLDTLSERSPVPERLHRVAALVACHSAVRLGDVLDPAEQQRLLDRLLATDGAATCPHGRPTVLVLDDHSLRRAFRRPVVG